MKKAVFFDRDGIINEVSVVNGVPISPRVLEDFKVYDSLRPVLEAIRKAGFLICVVTNQPDIARGKMTWTALEAMHAYLQKRLPVDDILVCPHDDSDRCLCRKPKPGLLLEASSRWEIDLARSFLVGDTWKDLEAGKAVGCRTLLLDASYNRDLSPDIRVAHHSGLLEPILGPATTNK